MSEGAKEAQIMVMWFIAFVNSHCFANKTHCCATFVVEECSTSLVFISPFEINVKPQWKLNEIWYLFKMFWEIFHGL